LLIISILLPLFLVYAVSMMIDMRNSRTEAITNVQIHLQDLVGKQAAQVDIYFSSIAQIPRTLSAALSAGSTPDGENLEAILRETLQTFPRLIGMCVAFEPNAFRDGIERFAPYVHRTQLEGNELFFADLAKTYKELDEEQKRDYMQWDWYRIPRKTGQATWSEPYLDEGGGDVLMCTYSVPFSQNGRFAGIVTVDVCLDDIQELVSQIAEKNVRYYLLSATGKYVVATDPLLGLAMKESIFSVAQKYQKKELAEAGYNMLRGEQGILAYSRVIDDRRVWIAYAPLPITGWTLKAAMDEKVVLEPVYASVYYTVHYFFVEFSVILLVIVLVTGRLVVPIKRLAGFARRLSAGDLDAKVGKIRFSKEIDQLASTFDKMVDDLKSNIERRIQEETTRKTVERELQSARKIQASLLPRTFPPFPDRNEFDLHALNEAVAVIAGDFFDFYFIKPDTLAFVIADVSGHGIPAALFMAVSRTAIRTFATPNHSPQEIINQVNRVLSTDNDAMMFVTLFYGHYNVKTGELTYVNAGHNPPYIVRKDGRLETLQATGPLVAALEDIAFTERSVRLEPGDLLVTYTDGVTEAHSTRDNVLYGPERLEQLLAEIRGESVATICNRIHRAADQFADHECHDDVTLLVLRRNETSD